METPFTQLNLSGIEHVWVEYHVAESLTYLTRLRSPNIPSLHLISMKVLSHSLPSAPVIRTLDVQYSCTCALYILWYIRACSVWCVEFVSTMMYSVLCTSYGGVRVVRGVWSVYPPWCIPVLCTSYGIWVSVVRGVWSVLVPMYPYVVATIFLPILQQDRAHTQHDIHCTLNLQYLYVINRNSHAACLH
jgi:hypothetical protein